MTCVEFHCMSLQKTADLLFLPHHLVKEGYDRACKLGMTAKIPESARSAYGKVKRKKVKHSSKKTRPKKPKAKKRKIKSAIELREDEKRLTAFKLSVIRNKASVLTREKKRL